MVIPTYTILASGANINYIGCVDNTLPTGTGIISANENNRHWFGSIMESQATWQEIKHSTNIQPVAIGYGYFAIGKEIYKFGHGEPVCMARDPVVSGTQGHHITRMLDNGNILEIKCHDHGFIPGFLSVKSYAFHFQHLQIIDGELMHVTEATAWIEDYSPDMFYLKGYLVIYRCTCPLLLIDCTTGKLIDKTHTPTYGKHKFIYGYSNLGNFDGTYPERNKNRFKDGYVRLTGTIDVIDGKFVIQCFGTKKQQLYSYVRQVYGLQPTEQLGWSDCYMAADNIMVVNFRLFCCLAADDATPAHSHPVECGLLSTKHRDSYGLIYKPTNTVIRLRDRPLYGKVLSDTPKILESHMSLDKRILALVVQSSEAIRTPTKNMQIVIIDTVTGQYEIAFSASFVTESALQADNIPEVLCLDTVAVVFKVFGQVIQQPILQARKDIMAAKLYDMARGSIPMELMQLVSAYLP